jgi:hypothetical protein
VTPAHVKGVVQDAEDGHGGECSICKAVGSELVSVSRSSHANVKQMDPTFSRGNRCKKRPFSSSPASTIRILSPAPNVAAAISRLKANGRKFTMAKRYTSADIRPIASGLYACQRINSVVVTTSTHNIVGFLLDRSLPPKPRRRNTSPVHGINAYEKANATPEMASEANNGSPSLRQALTSTEMQAMDNTLSEYVSVDVSACIVPNVHSSCTALLATLLSTARYVVDLRLLEQLAAADADAISRGKVVGLALELRLDMGLKRVSSRRSTLLLFDSCLQGCEDRSHGISDVLILPRRALNTLVRSSTRLRSLRTHRNTRIRA